MNLKDESQVWVDSEEYAHAIRGRFTNAMSSEVELREHRDFCRQGYGFGEDAFHWLWKLLVDEMPWDFKFLEVGVFLGQILSLVRLLADIRGYREARMYGVTLLSSFAGVTGAFPPHPVQDYRAGIQRLHDHFELKMPELIVGDSTSDEVHKRVADLAPFDMIFVDGCHEYDYVVKDLLFYPQHIRHGGFLICDDAACDLKQPWGFFQGVADVTRAVQTVIQTDPHWEHMVTVCHDRVWRKL